MISPLHVVQQLQERLVPRNWCVLRPARLYTVPASIILGVCYGLFFMMGGTFLLTGIFYPSLLHSEGPGPLGIPAITFPMALLSLMVSGGSAIYLATSAKRKSDAVLILMPEGVVSCEQYSNEAKRSYQVIDYATITAIKLEMPHRRRGPLVFQYHSGKWESWHISGAYISHAWIAQRIIHDHLRFRSSASGSLPSR